MGYYYNDPSGLGSWWVDDGQNPGEALVHWQEVANVVPDSHLVDSVVEQFPQTYGHLYGVVEGDIAGEHPYYGNPPTAAEPSGPSSGTPPPVGIVTGPTTSPVIVVPTGEPVSTAIVSTVATILAGLFSIFGGGVPSSVKRAFEGLRKFFSDIVRNLLDFVMKVVRALGRVYRALHTMWERVIYPLFQQVAKLLERLNRLIDRVLKPYLEFMRRARAQIMAIYDKYFRPTIEIIQMFRRAISILRLARVPGMKQLDEKLQRVQAKIMAPIVALLRRTNEQSWFINILLSAKMVLQRPILLGSMRTYRSSWINQFYNYQSKPVTTKKPPPVSQPQIIAIGVSVCSEFRVRLLRQQGFAIEQVDDFCRTFRKVLLGE